VFHIIKGKCIGRKENENKFKYGKGIVSGAKDIIQRELSKGFSLTEARS
jgi:hypothetical protein